jgi:hypothetical protein
LKIRWLNLNLLQDRHINEILLTNRELRLTEYLSKRITTMSIKFIGETFEYLVEAVAEVFSPDHDNYPSIGIQPFEDEPYREKSHH